MPSGEICIHTMAKRRKMLGAVFLVCVVHCCLYVHGQSKVSSEASDKGPANAGLPREDTLENTVFSEMLRIVDQKFDSLSARISVLERSVNSLNFYSVRQFREITESIEGSTETTDRLRNQVSKMDADDRALKAAVSQIGRDINGIKKDISVINIGMNEVKTDVGDMKMSVEHFRGNSAKMLDDIATSVVYLNENLKQNAEDMKGLMTGRVEIKLNAATNQRREATARILRSIEELDSRPTPPPPNCSINFRPLEERLDKRFAEIKRQAKGHFLDLLNSEAEEEEEDSKERDRDSSAPSNTIHHQPPQSQRAPARDGRWGDDGERGESRTRERRPGEDGEKVMRLLANMTRNVMDAVAYFRQTGDLMERLLATTEGMAEEQTRLRYDMLEASGLLTPGQGAVTYDELVEGSPQGGDQQPANASDPNPLNDELDSKSAGPEAPEPLERSDYAAARSKSYSAENPSKVRRSRTFGRPAQYFNPSPSGAHKPNCGANSEESLRVLAELAKNGTQLLDVLTDLAQLSSTSLTKAVGSLHEEVVRLEDVRARLNEGLLFPGGKSSSSNPNTKAGQVSGLNPSEGDLGGLQNTTKTIFTIVEAIASNTGWIPYIFHNMQQVERLTNRTLELAKRALLNMHWNRGVGGSSKLSAESEGDGQEGGEGEAPTQAEALDVIYDTNVQLLRIMPALTRLLAEPEPLIALAEGSSSAEGRVEVFYRGQWGSVCKDSMGHEEAFTVCKHLGHSGGIWAGDHHFGRGNGRYWLLNVTCLDTHLCPFIVNPNNTGDCPDGHFAVICDHMLRLTPVSEPDDNDDNNGKTGLVSLHHQGRWLPICSHGWSGYEARVACKQMGYQDGRELEREDSEWRPLFGNVTTWVSAVSCTGEETRLDSCKVDSFRAKTCADDAAPAAVRCQ